MQHTATIHIDELIPPHRLLCQRKALYHPCHLLVDERFQKLQHERRELRVCLQGGDHGLDRGVLRVGLRRLPLRSKEGQRLAAEMR